MLAQGNLQYSSICELKNGIKSLLKSAGENELGSFYFLLAARLFTAMMLEGVINFIGTCLDKDWEDNSKGIIEDHKKIRKILDLRNCSYEYQTNRALIKSLKEFRDNFAHPKIRYEQFDNKLISDNIKIPVPENIENLKKENVQSDFGKVLSYCEFLVNKSVAKLKDVALMKDNNSNDSPISEAYYDSYDVETSINELRLLLVSYGSGSYTIAKS